MVCLSNKNFEIADLLLEKGADINYNEENDHENSRILYRYKFDIQNVKYLLKNGLKDSNYLINKCYKQKELVEFIIQYYFYNEELVKVLLNIYKMKRTLSVKELQKVLSDFTKKVSNDDIYNKIKDEDVLNTLLKYEFDNKKRNKILLKFKIKKNRKRHNNDYDDDYDDDYNDES